MLLLRVEQFVKFESTHVWQLQFVTPQSPIWRLEDQPQTKRSYEIQTADVLEKKQQKMCIQNPIKYTPYNPKAEMESSVTAEEPGAQTDGIDDDEVNSFLVQTVLLA